MNQTEHMDNSIPRADRRSFLKTSAGTAGAILAGASVIPNVHAAGTDDLKVGLVGCGGRGSGAASDALRADKNTKLWALADVFPDQIDAASARFQEAFGPQFAVEDRRFSGFDAYKSLIDCCDVVLLATPPGFRPLHLKYAIEKGKHVFVEKPMAVDAPGVRSVLASCQEAKKKNLSIVAGFCWRYHAAMRETIRRVQDGAVGKFVALQCDYNTRRPRELVPRQPKWSDMEFQIRNWYFYTWLSGDHNVEQHVHSIDKMMWVMGDKHPISAYGTGGRQAIAEGEPGHIYDHHAVCYEFEGGLRCFSNCRQQAGTHADTSDWVFGTKGTAHLLDFQITGENAWSYDKREGRRINMYQDEHKELFASIRAGKPINDGEWMAKSTLMAIMGRMATYTGQVVTWDKAMNSVEDLTPTAYDWVERAEPAVAIPGITPLI